PQLVQAGARLHMGQFSMTISAVAGSNLSGNQHRSGQKAAPTMSRLYELAGQNWSCSPRRTCSQIGSCEEARWYLQNCPWGGRLDRDNDGILCESIC
ncbi:excalibur calcium-binding domain-containing protein, partial [Paracoccus lutimaris]|uniref:excalibur calcium-binding domain-containing protein n=1 Tax=Paracoccus lutimaris TaxID=1490030 RepID=UPI0011C05609